MADKSTNIKSPSEEKALKEKLLDEKMRLIRLKNEERLKRQKEIEEDIQNANTHDKDTKSKDGSQESRTMSGVAKDESRSVIKFRGRARGRALEKMSKETLLAKKFKEQQKTNYELVEKEIKEEQSSTGFLFDDRRVDMSKVGSRSTHSWGGSQFEDVVDRVNSVSKEQSRRTPKRDQNIEIKMTGKERLKYQEWKEERERVDQARQSRQKRGDTWKREWDWHKGQNSSSSFGGRQDREDRTRSGQRFGERAARQRPGWNYHDNRGDDDFQQDSASFSKNQENDYNTGSNVASLEDWGDVDQPGVKTAPQLSEQKGGFNKTSESSLPSTGNSRVGWDGKNVKPQVSNSSGRNTGHFKASKQNWDIGSSNTARPNTGSPQKAVVASDEDWEDDIDTTTTFTPLQQHDTMAVSHRISTEDKNTEPSNDYIRREDINSEYSTLDNDNKDSFVNSQESVSSTTNDTNMDYSALQTVNNDKQQHSIEDGKVKDQQNPSTDNLESQSLSDKANTTVQEINVAKDETKNSAENMGMMKNNTEEIVPKGDYHGNNDIPEDNMKEATADVTVNVGTKEGDEKMGETSTINTNETNALSSKASETVQHARTPSKGQEVIEDNDNTARDNKPKDSLPKLDLTKTDDCEEPVPDFLKTPQHKNWADYEFDEEELVLSQDGIFYQS